MGSGGRVGMNGETCAVCGKTVPVDVVQWGGATPYCPECFGTETGPGCGETTSAGA
jgi:hypothetical protein